MKTSRIVSAILAVAMTVSMTACGLSATAPAPAPEAPAPAPAPEASAPAAPAIPAAPEKVKGVTLTYVASQNWANKGSKVDDELNKKFEEETDIKIDMQVIPDDQYVNVLKTKLNTGEAPISLWYLAAWALTNLNHRSTLQTIPMKHGPADMPSMPNRAPLFTARLWAL